MAYSELPDDVEIAENERGQFEARSSERDVRSGPAQATAELAQVACLTFLNVRAAFERLDAAIRGNSRFAPRYEMTREQYERACDVLGAVRLPDSVCATLRNKRFEPPEHDAETIVTCGLATRRSWGLLAEERQLRQVFEKDLVRLPGFFSSGLSREQYEKTCAWVGAEPVPDDQVNDLKVKCFEQEEIADLVDLPLVLAKWRFTGMMKERQRRSQ